MEYEIWAACACHMGKVRENNEDNFYFSEAFLPMENMGLEQTLTLHCKSDRIQCFAVFDGMGGESKGELASYTAASGFSDIMKYKQAKEKNPKEFLTEAMKNLNEQVCQQAKKEKVAFMGSTGVVLYFNQDQVYVCNLGDSPAFRLRNGFWQKISQDHTNEEMLRRQGITDRKPALTQCLGVPKEEMQLMPYLAKGNLMPRDKFIICSDGLTDMVSQEEIANVLNQYDSPEESVEHLLEMALERGGRDNTTIIQCNIA